MMIGWTDCVAGTAEIITKLAFHIRFDFHLAVAGAGEENRRSDSLCALDSLRMIMGYLGGELRQMQRLLHTLCQPRRGRNPHGTAVAIAAVRLRIIFIQPLIEPRTVALVGISTSQLLHLPHQRRFDGDIILSASIQQGPCHGQRHYRIVGKFGSLAE